LVRGFQHRIVYFGEEENTRMKISSVAKQNELKTKYVSSNNEKILFFFSLLFHLYSSPSKYIIKFTAYLQVFTASCTSSLEAISAPL
jgi:hypothetical protein